ncbi:3-hydroxyacyl-CoA dehydrogenase family protein [Photobacterium sp.]|uniref:3-hydroxyacyl-CoA dehydrogenase family protein n=1 Tax=Photobacterium sp. TaxID=660 RepID=UPI00299DEAC3|nr:3-hydroxyacyl-CoA dehydrogenase NAD-binding domain-containing protein [Photobacterium sp.]MDX1303661.1 3-hydroxyacyl-CoA dehydrogenase NAD-binding domain-containing protein [Photobacterium sp.]
MNVALIGSGTMGAGIAQVLCSSETVRKIIVVSRSDEKGEAVISSCNKYLSKLKRKSIITGVQLDHGLSKISFTTSIQDVEGADLIIEAVAENYAIKCEIFKKIANLVTEKSIVATNTSSLSITDFASLLPYPERVVGLHFFNPAPVMELVEVVVGHVTDRSIVDELVEFTTKLGKSPVVVNEGPGFVVNRMLIPMINEAVSILAEGVANEDDIDKAMKLGAHHPMGPLKLADLIGNDVVLSIMETLYSETGDPKYRAHPLLRKMVRADHLGRKTKKGFFGY